MSLDASAASVRHTGFPVSLLSPDGTAPFQEGRPDCFGDLSLDRIVAAATVGRESYELTGIFNAPLRDPAVITYRQAVFRDFEAAALKTAFEAFAEAMQRSREAQDHAGKQRHALERQRWIVTGVLGYCRGVAALFADLRRLDPASDALKALAAFGAVYVGSEAFALMRERTEAVAARLLVTALAVGMPAWLMALDQAVPTYADQVAGQMRDGWLLVPLTAKFAFISPSKLIIVMPLLALIPVALLLISRTKRARRAPVWYGGKRQDPVESATTALSFSHALREFYSFVYRPQRSTRHELAEGSNGQRYFVRRLIFTHDVAPVFGPLLFARAERLARSVSRHLRRLQSGHLNAYLAFIGFLLALILIVPLLLH